MSRTKKIIIITSIIAVVGVASFFLIRKLRGKSTLVKLLENPQFNNLYDDSPYANKNNAKFVLSTKDSQFGDKKRGYGKYSSLDDDKGKEFSEALKFINSFYQKNHVDSITTEDIEYVKGYVSLYEGGKGKVSINRKVKDKYEGFEDNMFEWKGKPMQGSITIEFTDGRRAGEKISANSFKQLTTKIFEAPPVHIGEDGLFSI